MLVEGRLIECNAQLPDNYSLKPPKNGPLQQIYLSYGSICAIGGGRGNTVDHLIPQVVCNTYPALSPIKNYGVNKVMLCRNHHNEIDWGQTTESDDLAKLPAFFEQGLEGVVKSLIKYPDPKNIDLLTVKKYQWKYLFKYLDRRLPLVIDDLALRLDQLPHRDEYEFDGVMWKSSHKRVEEKLKSAERAKILVEDWLYMWNQGTELTFQKVA